MGFSRQQIQTFRELASAPQYAQAGPKVRKALGETAIVESGVNQHPSEQNLDSIGVLQQRPSQGWGSPQQLSSPRYQAEQFLKRAIPIAGKYSSAGQLAQAVQRSAFPERYDQHSGEAMQLLAQLGGGGQAQGQQQPMASPLPQAGPNEAQSADLVAALSQALAPRPTTATVTAPRRPESAGGTESTAGTPKIPQAPSEAPQHDPTAVLSVLAQLAAHQSALPTANEGGTGEAAPHTQVAEENPGHYVNPLPGFTKGRTDQGVDYSAKPGTPIRAIGNAQVLGISPNWFKGQPYVSYRLLDGPQKGKVVFVAEQISPQVKAGQRVRAGQAIGTYAPSGTGIEIGYGTNTGGQTLAKATTGYTEGQETQAGIQVRGLLERLGAR